jgi:hypothetical protein
MGKVFSHMTMSLDGYIAEPDDQVGELFEWYEAGDVTVPNPNENVLFKVDDASAELLRDLTENTGALIAAGTCSTSPMVGTTSTRSTHSSSSSRIARRRMPPKKWPTTTFVDGVEAAITRAKQIAGDKKCHDRQCERDPRPGHEGPPREDGPGPWVGEQSRCSCRCDGPASATALRNPHLC